MATRMPLRPVKRRARPRRRVARTETPPTVSTFDRDYWLAHCEGYRVDATEGRIGFVESVHTGGAKRGRFSQSARGDSAVVCWRSRRTTLRS